MELGPAYVAAEPKGITGFVGSPGLSVRFERRLAPQIARSAAAFPAPPARGTLKDADMPGLDHI